MLVRHISLDMYLYSGIRVFAANIQIIQIIVINLNGGSIPSLATNNLITETCRRISTTRPCWERCY